ncbi:condensation domain-containing protein, partial [Aestuariivirga sp.]|uniref:condensation domain-containing protein n=1 Tax=Aestuariivirga sp. TaxID=2650926 RepID=UPI003015B9A8
MRLPLTAAQRGVWFGHLADPDGQAYNIGQYTEIVGDIDVAVFQAAARHVYEGTEALRLRVYEADGELWQDLCAPRPFDVPVDDVSPAADPHGAALALLGRDLEAPFDLVAGPLFRFRLVKLAAGRWYWGQAYHHVAIDGISASLIAARVAESYTVLAAGQALPVWRPALAELIAVDASYRQSPAFAEGRAFWRDALSGCEAAPSWSGARPTGGKLFVRQTLYLPEALTVKLQALGLENGGGPGRLVIVAATLLQAMHGRSEDVVIGLPLLGRRGRLARETPMMASNIGHIRLRVSGGTHLSDLQSALAAAMRGALRHQLYRFEDLDRDMGGGVLKDMAAVSVNLMPFSYDLTFGGLPSATHNLSNGPVGGLALSVYDHSDSRQLRLDLDGNRDFYTVPELRLYLTQLEHILAQLVEAAPGLPVGALA